MTDAIELLRRDHDEVRALLSELEASADPGRADPRERRRAAVVQSPDPEVLRLAGRIAGATDRIRDALAGRSGR
jgi:hypothetical protein